MAEIEGYNLPDGLAFHKEHSWAKVEDDGKVRVGMTEFFAKSAGDIVYVDLPFDGDDVSQDETCGKVQSSKWIGKLIAPVSGEIAEINEELENDSTLINSDPYGEGWIMLIDPSDLDSELGNLMSSPEDLTTWMQEEIKKAEDGKQE